MLNWIGQRPKPLSKARKRFELPGPSRSVLCIWGFIFPAHFPSSGCHPSSRSYQPTVFESRSKTSHFRPSSTHHCTRCPQPSVLFLDNPQRDIIPNFSYCAFYLAHSSDLCRSPILFPHRTAHLLLPTQVYYSSPMLRSMCFSTSTTLRNHGGLVSQSVAPICPPPP